MTVPPFGEPGVCSKIALFSFTSNHSQPVAPFQLHGSGLELVLKSPGRIEQARQGRDYSVFNLGSEVSRLVRGKGNEGKRFIADILDKRRRFFLRHPGVDALTVLGDQRLSDIAAAIGKAFETPEGRKRIYWGLSALTNLCVGDVGEVIRLYEDILKQGRPNEFPVAAETQHKCFQHICTSALHDVNRRNTKFKDHALGFANAAHKLLRKSLAVNGPTSKRVRQYAQVYVSIPTANEQWIFREIRELIDAGIYVLDAATAAPRTKRVNADPIQQFILTYRKLYGLSTLIGLAYRDRFELSGADLEAWLREPTKAEEVFLRNEGGADEQQIETEAESEEILGLAAAKQAAASPAEESKDKAPQPGQIEMPLWGQPQRPATQDAGSIGQETAESLGLTVESLRFGQCPRFDLVIAGFGIEERCEASLRVLLASPNGFGVALLVAYPEKGRTDPIQGLFDEKRISTSKINVDTISGWTLPPHVQTVMVDISGLAKPAIFHFCRHVLEQRKSLYICHTQAVEYFPTDQDIEPILKAHTEGDVAQLLQGVAGLFQGEEKPYHCVSLLAEQQDDSRPRALIAFSSPKHERLLTLIDGRYYDCVGIGYSSANSGRGKISEMAAHFAVRNINGAVCYPISSTNLVENIDFLARLYFDLYHRSGYNVEIGLTGSKASGLAAAILAARWKVAQAWYVIPERFNVERFTTGVGPSLLYRVGITDGARQPVRQFVS